MLHLPQCLLERIRTQAVLFCLPLIPAFGKQKLVDLYEFEASLIYIGGSSPA